MFSAKNEAGRIDNSVYGHGVILSLQLLKQRTNSYQEETGLHYDTPNIYYFMLLDSGCTYRLEDMMRREEVPNAVSIPSSSDDMEFFYWELHN